MINEINTYSVKIGKSSIFYLLTVLCFQCLNLSSQNLGLQSGPAYDSCRTKPVHAVLKTADFIFNDKDMPHSIFQKLTEISVVSECPQFEFRVRRFRMIGIAERKDPVVIEVGGNKITKKHKEKFSPLGRKFDLYIEGIVRDSGHNCTNGLKYKVY